MIFSAPLSPEVLDFSDSEVSTFLGRIREQGLDTRLLLGSCMLRRGEERWTHLSSLTLVLSLQEVVTLAGLNRAVEECRRLVIASLLRHPPGPETGGVTVLSGAAGGVFHDRAATEVVESLVGESRARAAKGAGMITHWRIYRLTARGLDFQAVRVCEAHEEKDISRVYQTFLRETDG